MDKSTSRVGAKRGALVNLCHGHPDIQEKIRKLWPSPDLMSDGGDRKSEGYQPSHEGRSYGENSDYFESRLRRATPRGAWP